MIAEIWSEFLGLMQAAFYFTFMIAEIWSDFLCLMQAAFYFNFNQ